MVLCSKGAHVPDAPPDEKSGRRASAPTSRVLFSTENNVRSRVSNGVFNEKNQVSGVLSSVPACAPEVCEFEITK